MTKIQIPSVLKKMNSIFTANGFEAYLVGGAVRDMILGKKASDYDVTTNATPEQVTKIFHKVIPTGIAHGTVTVHLLGEEIEVTTYRAEHGYSDGRHPDSISFNATLEDDLSRRDFTMNAIAASLEDGHIEDPFDGIGDIKKGIIRTVGIPYDRFMEDGLRPIRALRFSSQLKFDIDRATFDAIANPDVQKKMSSISMERFRDEFEKILKTETPSVGLHFMEETGVLDMFIPELASCRGITQSDPRGFHEFDVLDHNIYACDGAPHTNLAVRTAALFHDLGKKDTKKVEKKAVYTDEPDKLYDIYHFHGHENVSAQKTKEILFRLKFPNSFIDRVCHLIKEHMFFYESTWTDAAVRRFIVRVQKDYLDDLFELRYADVYGMHRVKVEASSDTVLKIIELKDRIKSIEKESGALSLKDLAVNGRDLIEQGIKPGKHLGSILENLFQTVLDDPEMNDKEKLITVAKKLAGID